MLDVSRPCTVRFAPSPTGSLHLGNARTAVLNYLLAHRSGGRFLLRIEDTDAERSSFAAEAELLFALAWLGLVPDGPVVRQSTRLARYQAVARQLLHAGRAYPCFCPEERLAAERAQALARGEAPRYSGRCRRLPQAEALARMDAGEPHTVRLAVEPATVAFTDAIKGPVEVPTSAFGDFVLLRSTGWPSYNFAAVVDDLDMGITVVLRGEDHLTNTARQILLYAALGATPPVFAHHGLLVDRHGKKLSKRSGATTVLAAREAGIPPLALAHYLAAISGAVAGNAPATSLEELAERFDPASLGRGNAVFLAEDLAQLAARAFRLQDPAAICQRLDETLPADDPWHSLAEAERHALVAALAPEAPSLEALRALLPIATHPAPLYCAEAIPAALRSRAALAAVLEELAPLPADARLAPAEAAALLRRASARCGAKGRAFYHPLRLALTGIHHGPELAVVLGLVPVAALRHRLALFVHPDVQEPSCNSTTP